MTQVSRSFYKIGDQAYCPGCGEKVPSEMIDKSLNGIQRFSSRCGKQLNIKLLYDDAKEIVLELREIRP